MSLLIYMSHLAGPNFAILSDASGTCPLNHVGGIFRRKQKPWFLSLPFQLQSKQLARVRSRHSRDAALSYIP